MRGRSLAAIVGALLLGAGAVPLGQQAPVFRATTQTVPVYVTVIGPDGHLVTDLPREAFTVLDNGRPQPLTLFDAGRQPIAVTVMLDTSGSMIGNLPTLRNAAVQLFTRLESADRARIGHFGDRIVIGPDFTNDVDTLIRALWLDIEPGGPTPLWGGVNAAMASMASLEGRRVVLVFSDGYNTGLRSYNGIPSGPTLDDVVRRAQAEDFMIYAIGMRSRTPPGFGGGRGGRRRGGGTSPSQGGGRSSGGVGSAGGAEPDPGLRTLAAESGGGYFELDDSSDLGGAFARVADELHHQYLLGFAAPEHDGALHGLDVQVADPSLRPRARRTYRAPSSARD